MIELFGHKCYFNCSLKFDLCVLCPWLNTLQTLDVLLVKFISTESLGKACLVSSFVAFICFLNMFQNIQVVVFLLYQCSYITVYNTHFGLVVYSQYTVVLHIDFPINTLPFCLVNTIVIR